MATVNLQGKIFLPKDQKDAAYEAAEAMMQKMYSDLLPSIDKLRAEVSEIDPDWTLELGGTDHLCLACEDLDNDWWDASGMFGVQIKVSVTKISPP
jgi:hypothetical protein